jgi:hypothetical protein
LILIARGKNLRGQALIIDIQGKSGEASRERPASRVEGRGEIDKIIDNKIILKNKKTGGYNKLGVSVHFLSFCFIAILLIRLQERICLRSQALIIDI